MPTDVSPPTGRHGEPPPEKLETFFTTEEKVLPMSINERAALSPEMLLFEIAAMCSRHGLAIPANANPAAARHYAERLMHALGLVDDAPAGVLTSAPDVTAPIPVIRDGAFVADPPERPWPLPLRGPRGAHRMSRPLAAVPNGNG